MSTASITVAVGWTSVRPVIPDQHISYVTVPIECAEFGFAIDGMRGLRAFERIAILEAFGVVAARTHATQWMPKVEMITSMNIVKETL